MSVLKKCIGCLHHESRRKQCIQANDAETQYFAVKLHDAATVKQSNE
jgi:hypothetical protein